MIDLAPSRPVPEIRRVDAVDTPCVVMPYTYGQDRHCSVHEKATRAEVVRRLARLKGCVSSDELPRHLWPAHIYLIPGETITGLVHARNLGLKDEADLFGGVVPHAFMATKAITHPLVSPAAAAPYAWNTRFPELVAGVVLPGFSAFSGGDAEEAAAQLLPLGPVRVKPVAETGGHGQVVVSSLAELRACLARINKNALSEYGVVLEQNLSDVSTMSVGQVRVGTIVASYFGHQYLTINNTGSPTYGGSALTVVRGDFHALTAMLPAGPLRMAVDQALVYDSAAQACFTGFFASRINYDVAQGFNAAGQWCSGVLEQSWRMGGATGAEIAALEAFHADKELMRVRARCVEKFGPLEPVPTGAAVYFQGEDPQAGLLTKYALVDKHEHPA
ncbi:MAG: DUF3182 family protein [Pseudomonadota bacterium]